ncbi:MAG: T9SS type A sorting domain-containing protein [bacterium]
MPDKKLNKIAGRYESSELWRTLCRALWYFTCFIVFSLLYLFASSPAKTSATQFGTLQLIGLEGQTVTALAAEVQELPLSNDTQSLLFVGTDTHGVFQVPAFESSYGNWSFLGLQGKPITALTVQHWGVGPADGLTLFAAVLPGYQQSDSTLIYRKETFHVPIDTLWTPADNGVNRNKLKRVNVLNSYYYSGHLPPQPAVMGGEVGLYQNNPFVGIWREAEVEGSAKIYAIDVYPRWLGSLAWAVGSQNSAPAAFRSTDKGRAWTTFPLPSFVEGEALSVAIHPHHPDTVYVGHKGGVLMTPDSGKTWQQSGLQNSAVRFRALTVDPSAPENLFAGGISDNNLFAFYHSSNGGSTWSEIQPEQEIAGVTALVALHSDLPERQTFVFIGTAGSGVWLYKTAMITNVQDGAPIPDRFKLHQNYPNPFNPETTIAYEIARPGHVELSVYNLLGQQVRKLVNGWRPAGFYRVKWDGVHDSGGLRAVSGVYVYELKVAQSRITKKMVLLR